MIADTWRVRRVLKPPDQGCRDRALTKVVQPAVLICCPLQQVFSNVEARADPVVEGLDVSVGDLLGRAFRHPGPGRPLRGHRPKLVAETRGLGRPSLVLALTEVGQRKKEPTVGYEVVGDLVFLLLARQVVAQKGEADAPAAIVGHEMEPRQPHDLPHEVVDELRVVLQHVRIAVLRLVREAEPGKVEDGHEVVLFQEGNHLPEVETRRRIAVEYHERRVGAVPKGPVEDLHPTALVIASRRGPLEVLSAAVPCLGERGIEGEVSRRGE